MHIADNGKFAYSLAQPQPLVRASYLGVASRHQAAIPSGRLDRLQIQSENLDV
jgi:hypothetical protein